MEVWKGILDTWQLNECDTVGEYGGTNASWIAVVGRIKPTLAFTRGNFLPLAFIDLFIYYYLKMDRTCERIYII